MLSEMQIGQTFIIESLSAVDPKLRRRMRDLGMAAGSKTTVIDKLPFGGPYILSVKDQSLAIRKMDASRIKVKAL